MAAGLLLLRITIGLTLAAHGAQKLWGWFGGLGLARTGQAFETIGFRPGRRHAHLAGLVEVATGAMVFITDGGYEFNVVFGAAALVLAFTGPGAYSVDAALGVTASGTGWGVGTLAVSAIGAAGQLAQRRAIRGLRGVLRTARDRR